MLSCFVASAAGAQSFSDGNFTSGWTQSTYVDPNGCSGGSISTSCGGGNPDAYLNVYNVSCAYGPYQGFVHNAHLSPYTWNPSAQGAILGVSMSADLRADGAMAFLPVLRQGGNYFVRGGTTAYSYHGWLAFNAPENNLGWCQLFPAWSAGNNFNCGAAQINFSTSGGD